VFILVQSRFPRLSATSTGEFRSQPFLFSQTIRGVPKWVKLLIAILLLPVCAGAAESLWRVLRASGGADTTWVPFLAGVACWVVIFLLLPKPMWIYVFGHELADASGNSRRRRAAGMS
jgi:Zn-dependent protease